MLQTRRFFLLLAAIFILRGLAIQCLYPPLEGPDEYQHIAVIQYLVENRSLPVFGRSFVPVSLYEDIVANPHPKFSADQTARIGALSYEDFYTAQPELTGHAPIRLYQAQHPPLYYLTMAPVYAVSRSMLDFRSTVYLLRLINLCAAAVAIVLLLYPLRRFLADDALGRLCCLAVAASPMFMIYVSRIANDPFALLFAGLALVVALRGSDTHRPRLTAGLAGICAGLAVLSKLNGLLVLPALFGYWLFQSAMSTITWRRFAECAAYCIGGYLLISLPFHVWAFELYGTFLPQQETIRNAGGGSSTLAALLEIRLHHSNDFFLRKLANTLWTSGWSFLNLPLSALFVYQILLLSSACGCLFLLIKRRRDMFAGFVRDAGSFMSCLLLAFFTFCAFYMHGLHSLVAYGFFATPTYYIMIGYPALLSCFFAAALGYGRRIAAGFALMLLLVFVYAELYGLLYVAAPHWTNTGEWSVIFERLTDVHPVFPSPAYFFVLYAAALVLLGIALRPALQAFRSQR